MTSHHPEPLKSESTNLAIIEMSDCNINNLSLQVNVF